MGQELSLLTVQAYGRRLVKFRRFFVLEFSQQQKVNVVFKLCMKPIKLGCFSIGLILDPAIDIGMTDRIGDIVA